MNIKMQSKFEKTIIIMTFDKWHAVIDSWNLQKIVTVLRKSNTNQ